MGEERWSLWLTSKDIWQVINCLVSTLEGIFNCILNSPNIYNYEYIYLVHFFPRVSLATHTICIWNELKKKDIRVFYWKSE